MELRLLVGHLQGGLTDRAGAADVVQAAVQARRTQFRAATRRKNDKTPPVPSGLLHVIVSIDKQRATLFADGAPVASTAISSGTAEPSDADGRVHGHPEEPAPRLQSLRRADALHAAHHLVGLGAARRAPARLSGVAWLRPPDHELRATALEGDQDGRARHRHPARGCAAGVRPRPPVRAEAEDGGGAEPAGPSAHGIRRSGTSDDGDRAKVKTADAANATPWR